MKFKPFLPGSYSGDPNIHVRINKSGQVMITAAGVTLLKCKEGDKCLVAEDEDNPGGPIYITTHNLEGQPGYLLRPHPKKENGNRSVIFTSSALRSRDGIFKLGSKAHRHELEDGRLLFYYELKKRN